MTDKLSSKHYFPVEVRSEKSSTWINYFFPKSNNNCTLIADHTIDHYIRRYLDEKNYHPSDLPSAGNIIENPFHLSIGNVDPKRSSPQGLFLENSILSAAIADENNPGLISILPQTIAGSKNFNAADTTPIEYIRIDGLSEGGGQSNLQYELTLFTTVGTFNILSPMYAREEGSSVTITWSYNIQPGIFTGQMLRRIYLDTATVSVIVYDADFTKTSIVDSMPSDNGSMEYSYFPMYNSMAAVSVNATLSAQQIIVTGSAISSITQSVVEVRSHLAGSSKYDDIPFVSATPTLNFASNFNGLQLYMPSLTITTVNFSDVDTDYFYLRLPSEWNIKDEKWGSYWLNISNGVPTQSFWKCLFVAGMNEFRFYPPFQNFPKGVPVVIQPFDIFLLK